MSPEIDISESEYGTIRSWIELQRDRGKNVELLLDPFFSSGVGYNLEGEAVILYYKDAGLFKKPKPKLIAPDGIINDLKSAGLVKTEGDKSA